MNEEKELLKGIFHLVGRIAFNEQKLIDIITSKKAGPKQVKAFNLCDGTKTLGEIAKESGIEPGNFSKTVNRWVSEGILVKLVDGKTVRPLHLFPVTEAEEDKEDY